MSVSDLIRAFELSSPPHSPTPTPALPFIIKFVMGLFYFSLVLRCFFNCLPVHLYRREDAFRQEFLQCLFQIKSGPSGSAVNFQSSCFLFSRGSLSCAGAVLGGRNRVCFSQRDCFALRGILRE